MKTTTAKTNGRAKYYVIAVSIALAGTRFRSMARKTVGEFETLDDAQKFAEAQSRRPEVANAESRIHFVIRHKGWSVAKIEPKQKGAI